MSKHTIAWLSGDPMSRHLLDLAHGVLEKLKPDIDIVTGDIGWIPWSRDGNPVPDRTLELIKHSECAMVAATPFPPTPVLSDEVQAADPVASDHPEYQDPWMILARRLYLHTEMRPCRAFPGNPLNRLDGLDLVVFRSLLEGAGSGAGFCPVTFEAMELISSHPRLQFLTLFPPEEIAMNCRIVTRQGFEHVVRRAFEFAARNKRKGITVVDVPDVFPETAEMVIRTSREIAVDFPALQYREESLWSVIDNLISIRAWGTMPMGSHELDATDLSRASTEYDVIVTENLCGEFLCRVAYTHAGGAGFASRVALNDQTAIVGPMLNAGTMQLPRSHINPFGTLIATRMLLEFLGDVRTASVLGKAIEQVILDGKIITPDIGGISSNAEVCRAVADKASAYLDLV